MDCIALTHAQHAQACPRSTIVRALRLCEKLRPCHLGMRGYLTRHNLAVMYGEQGRLAEAEAQWRAALAEQLGYVLAMEALARLR
jgi:hypothetical protein